MRTKRLSAVLCLIAMLAVMIFGTMTVNASPMSNLRTTLVTGKYMGRQGTIKGNDYDYTKKSYKADGGGLLYWNQLVNEEAATDDSAEFFKPAFETLKKSSKQEFLEDLFRIANAMAYDTANGDAVDGANQVNDRTVNDFMQTIQNAPGMGSMMLATLLQNTKPDFVSANRLYQPFSGVVGTILGVISVVIMALLGITMALDIAFIVIPAFQLMMGADGSGENGKDNANKMSRLISSEARQAVQANGDSNGSGGQSGSDKQALGIYFKKRWKSLVLLGICLLYLVSGQIYSLVAWIIDLVSGFLG